MEGQRLIGYRKLQIATAVYIGANLLHVADHARRGFDVLTTHVFWAGNANLAVNVVIVALVLLRHRLAPLAAALGGFAIAVGVSAAHLLPYWSAFSDSLPDGNVDVFTWTAVVLEVSAAFVLGLTGLYVARKNHVRLSPTGGAHFA